MRNYDFRKDILSCSDKGVSSTNGIARKRTGFFSLFTKVLPLFALLFCATGSAQNESYPFLDWYTWKYALEWNPENDCTGKIPYRDGRQEELSKIDCIVACQNSTVTYFMRDFYATIYAVQSIEWEVEGGVIE